MNDRGVRVVDWHHDGRVRYVVHDDLGRVENQYERRKSSVLAIGVNFDGEQHQGSRRPIVHE